MSDNSDTITFVSYATEWDSYVGDIGWDELTIIQQNDLIRSICGLTDTPYGEKVMSADIRKSEIEGLSNFLLAASLLLEKEDSIDAFNQWDDYHQELILALCEDTLLGERLEKVFAYDDQETDNYPQIYEAELFRVSSFDQYDGMLQLTYSEMQEFISCIFTRCPDENYINTLSNEFISPTVKSEIVSVRAVILDELSKEKIYEIYESDKFGAGLIKSSDAVCVLEKLKSIGLLNYVSTDHEIYYDPERKTDDALSGEFIVWLSKSGHQLGKMDEVIRIAQSYLTDSRVKHDATKAIFDKRKVESEKRKIEIYEQINKDGGRVMPGLYHGERRIRAEYGDLGWANGYGWKICQTEEDIIKAIGIDRISDDINVVDLQKKYGLVIKDELAPVRLYISEHGTLKIERIDKWGQGAKPYVENTSPLKKTLKCSSYKDVLFILVFFPFCLSILVSDKLTSRVNKIICIALVLCFFAFPMMMEKVLQEYSLSSDMEGIVLIISSLYFATSILPFWHNGFQKRSL